MNCCPLFLPPSLSHTNTQRQILWLWHAHSGRWRVSLFSLSASIPLYFTYIHTHRGIEQIIYKSAPSLTHSYNMPICFFSIIKLAFSSRFLPVPLVWRSVHHANCKHLTNILFFPPPFYNQWQVRVIRFFFSSVVPERLETQQNNVTWQQQFTTINPRCLKKYSGTTAPFPLKWTLKEKPRSTVNSCPS